MSARVVGFLCSLVIIALPIAIWLLIHNTAVDVPFMDEWEWAELVYRFHIGTLSFNDLWTQHNEHRLFFPQLILLGFDYFGGWSQVREQYLSLFFLVCTQIIVLFMIRRTIRGMARIVASTGASILLYGLWQSENFTWGFQMGWFLCNAAAVIVAALLTRSFRNGQHFAAALTITIVASFSLAPGLICWAVGAVAILTSQRRVGPRFVIWIASAFVTYAVYRYHLLPSSQPAFSLIDHPLTDLRYMLAYLGGPVDAVGGVGLSTCAGAFVVTLIIASALADVKRTCRVRHLQKRGVWYALAIYPILGAALTAFGRVQFGLEQALSSRYTTISGMAWIAALCLCATYASDKAPWIGAIRRSNVIIVAATLLAVLVYSSEITGWRTWKATEHGWADARRGLLMSDPATLAKLYPSRDRIEMLLDEMRKIHDGPFRDE